MRIVHRCALVLACLCVGFANGGGPMPPASCLQFVSGEWEQHVSDLRQQMPSSSTEGFQVPLAAELTAWETVVALMVAEDFSGACTALLQEPSLSSFEMVEFTDTSNANAIYYVLQETTHATGWGHFAMRTNSSMQRNIAIEIPHPLFDSHTWRQGAETFRDSGARFFLLAGTHRCANAAPSGCDGSTSVCGDGVYHISDVAHNPNTTFHVSHRVAVPIGGGTIAIQFHAHGQAACEDVFVASGISNSFATSTTDIASALVTEFAGDHTVGFSGDGFSTCPLQSTTNTQGRFSHGSVEPCQTAAVGPPTGEFISLEQIIGIRSSQTNREKVTNAINAAF